MQEAQEMQVRSLGQEGPLEEDGSPLQYSCLENPMGTGAWWATVHGVAESDTTEHTHIQRHWGRKAGMVWSSRILADC